MSEKINVPDVTLTMTIGGRPSLLRQSLKTIVDNYEFPHVVAINDFNDRLCDEVFLEFFPNGVLISDGVKRGHHGAMSELYKHIETRFVLHTEDDWVFDGGINFDKIKKLLNENKKITEFCLRDVYSFLNASEVSKISANHLGGVSFFDLSNVHEEWYSYTFNPHLIKFENIELLGDYRNYKKERHISRFFKKQGMFVAYAYPGVCHHIGDGLSVANPNASKKKSKFRIWIRKKFNNLKLFFKM